MKKDAAKNFYEIFESIIIALVIILALVLFVFRAVSVDGESMEPNLHDKDRLIITNFLYTPQKGDIVVVDKNNILNKPIVKRVIATAGDTIKIEYSTGSVYLNGVKLDEDFILEDMYTYFNPNSLEITIEEGYVFVMGDNRNNSNDSRNSDIGPISVKNILGKAVLRVAPFNNIGVIK